MIYRMHDSQNHVNESSTSLLHHIRGCCTLLCCALIPMQNGWADLLRRGTGQQVEVLWGLPKQEVPQGPPNNIALIACTRKLLFGLCVCTPGLRSGQVFVA